MKPRTVPRGGGLSAWPVVATLAVVLGLSAQERTTRTFRTGVEAVLVDVSVLDANRRPVHGLTAADFSLLEDGQPQKILTFAAVDAPRGVAEEQRAAWWHEVPADVTSNAVPSNGRLVVVVLDDLLPMAPGDSPRAKQLAATLVDALGPADLAGLVFLSGLRPAVNLTLDHARLRNAASTYEPRWSRDFDETTPSTAGARAETIYRTAAASIRNLVEALGQIHGRRKALLWVTAGMTLDLARIDDARGPGSSNALREEWIEIFQAASRGNVSIYPIDPGGLRGVAIRLDQLDPASRAADLEGDLNVRFLEDVANNTGGIVVARNNDPGPGLSRVFEEMGSYYLLGYQSSSPAETRMHHRLEVRVAQRHVTVRARKDLWSRPLGKERSSPTAARASVVPIADVGLTAAVAPFLGTGGTSSDIAVVLGVSQPSAPRLETTIDTVHLVVSAFGSDGKLAGSVTTRVKVGLPAGRDNVEYELLTRMRLKPGRYELRAGVTTELDPKAGSLTCDVEVPDFPRLPLSMSGLVLSTEPAGFVAPTEALGSFLSVIPTARRLFATADSVSVAFRIYQGRRRDVRSVPLQILVRAASGATEFAHQETLDSGRFSRGCATEYRLRLPLERLATGPHLLTVTAGSGTGAVRRHLRFESR